MVGPPSGGGGNSLENANPLVYRRQGERPTTAREQDEGLPDAIDGREIFDLIRGIHDPEHPLTLEELNVVEQVRVQVSDAGSAVSVEFTPTIPHCSMATLIGLSIKVKLIRSLPERFKVIVSPLALPPHYVQGEPEEAAPWEIRDLKSQNWFSENWKKIIAVDVHITPGTHASEHAVNKQLADKERVAAALENMHLLQVVNQCLSGRS